MKAVISGRWAYNQCDSICVLVGLLIDELLLIMALSQFWIPPYKPRSPTTRASCAPLLPMQSAGKMEPNKASPSPSCLQFSSLPTLHTWPRIKQHPFTKDLEDQLPNETWAPSPSLSLLGHLQSGDQKGLTSLLCRAYDGFAFLVRNHAVRHL